MSYDDLDTETGKGQATAQLIAAGGAIAGVKEKDDLLYAIVPDGYKLETEDIRERQEKLGIVAKRLTGNTDVANVESFCNLCDREFVENTTVCFSDLDGSTFKTIFNYAGPHGQFGWGDRSVTLRLKTTTKWDRWNNNNNVKLNQLRIADFFEANIDDIVEPEAAQVIEMVKALKVKKKASFTSVVDQNTGGTSIKFTEDVNGSAIKGNIDFFGKFTIGITPFYGSSPYKVECNLRFNIDDDNRLSIFYTMINADLVKENAFDVEREKILDGMKALGVPVFDI